MVIIDDDGEDNNHISDVHAGDKKNNKDHDKNKNKN